MVKAITTDGEVAVFDLFGRQMMSATLLEGCAELDFSNIELNEFDGLEFNLDPANDGAAFFRRIPEYGIELIPVKGHSVKIPGYGYNNGYYSDNLEISLTRPGEECIYFNITKL